MISLEHIRTLESKVNKAVSRMAELQEENLQLKASLAQHKARIEELEFTVEEYREDQSEIEQGIMQALQHLDNLESTVGGLKVQPAAAVEVQAAPEAPEVAESAAEPVEAPVKETHWEAPVQQFQPAPLPQEEYEPVAPPAEQEPESSREQQLDIF